MSQIYEIILSLEAPIKLDILQVDYDYIICGAGCAGLSLAYRLCNPGFEDKRVLILDRSLKKTNDRTWSYWAKPDETWYDMIVHKKWKSIVYFGPGLAREQNIHPYTYQTIRGIDFYNHCLSRIDQSRHVVFKQESIVSIESQGRATPRVITDQGTYSASLIFNSTLKHVPEDHPLFVWQHFKGWVIRSETAVFDDQLATFMDFRIPQNGDIKFVYVLPWSPYEALVEATFFTREICEDHIYDEIIASYIKDYLNLSNITIVETEKGAIPMTTARFEKAQKGIIHIGTAGGGVKASTGYAFKRIQRESDMLADLIAHGDPTRPGKGWWSRRFHWYDRTFLDVLITGKQSGQRVFTLLFKHNEPKRILKFLDEDTNLLEEIKIFMTLPFFSFLRAFFDQNVLKKTVMQDKKRTK